MAASYIPSTDTGLDGWATNFASLITASPATYGLDATAAAAIQTARDTYHDAYLLAGTAPPHRTPVNPSTRTPVTVAAKDSAKIAGRILWRSYAAQIRVNPGVADADKLALGLNLPSSGGTPVPAPTSFPLLSFVSGAPLTHVFSYKDSDVPTGKAKAPGAVQMQLAALVAVGPSINPDTWPLILTPTKSPFQVLWSSGDGGKVATYAARWATRRGLVGPWSALSNFTILSS